MPNGGAGNPPGFKGTPGTGGAGPLVAGVAGLGVEDLFPSSEEDNDFLDADGAGVDEAEDRPLLGLTGSFFAWLESPFSLGGVRR